jgi:hypothetical protein
MISSIAAHCKGTAVERALARRARLGVMTNKIASRGRSACLQPDSCNRSPNHLASMQMPYRDPASEGRSAQERHGQNDVMPGVRRIVGGSTRAADSS